MKTLTTFLILILTAFSVVAQDSNEQTEYFILERLPEWFMKDNPLNGLELKDNYIFDNRMNPLYLEADFNGDGNFDIAIPIKNKSNESLGFAIIHGKTNEIFIIGAGTKIKNALSDNRLFTKNFHWKFSLRLDPLARNQPRIKFGLCGLLTGFTNSPVRVPENWDRYCTLWNNVVSSIPVAHAGHTQNVYFMPGVCSEAFLLLGNFQLIR